jgi:spore coat polysaccharide biosynthesis predicted glycosyltransferase SpsG
MGHIMRCIGLAQGFKKLAVKSVFVVRDYECRITDFLCANGYEVETISKDSNLTEDASLTLNFAFRHGAKIIITDISNRDTVLNIEAYSEYLKRLKHNGVYLVTIDGFNGDCISDKLAITADMVVVPYYGAENKSYKTNGSTKFLLGTRFFIFTEGFAEAAKTEKQTKETVDNILVSMGGSDPFNYTLKVSNALVRLNRAYLNLKVVIGRGFAADSKPKITDVLEDFKGSYKIINGTDEMAKLMLWADLAIISSGLTVYEAALMSTPSVVLSQYEYQEEVMNRFSKAGSFLYLGCGNNIGEKVISEAVDKLLDDFVLRNRMAESGGNFVDGKGIERIISGIPRELLV